MKTLILLILLLIACSGNDITQSEWDALPEYDYNDWRNTPLIREGFTMDDGFPVVQIRNVLYDEIRKYKVDTVKYPFVVHWRKLPEKIRRINK